MSSISSRSRRRILCVDSPFLGKDCGNAPSNVGAFIEIPLGTGSLFAPGYTILVVLWFAVLLVAILPFLQSFGFITALTIVYAFLASVFVLPSLLVGWARFGSRTVP